MRRKIAQNAAPRYIFAARVKNSVSTGAVYSTSAVKKSYYSKALFSTTAAGDAFRE
jgi:hypothetical protein